MVVYILQWALPGDLVFQDFAYANIFAGSEPWRMLTSAFLHSQGFLLHIVLNMYSLWIFGQVLEPLLGRLRFLAVYLLAAVGGSVGFLLLTPTRPSLLDWLARPERSSASLEPCWWSSANVVAKRGSSGS